VTIKNLSKTKNLEFLPMYVNDEDDEEPERVVDLKCGGEVRV
jgi:alpha-tubulin suppressor-like RCC1 family protein